MYVYMIVINGNDIFSFINKTGLNGCISNNLNKYQNKFLEDYEILSISKSEYNN